MCLNIEKYKRPLTKRKLPTVEGCDWRTVEDTQQSPVRSDFLHNFTRIHLDDRKILHKNNISILLICFDNYPSLIALSARKVSKIFQILRHFFYTKGKWIERKRKHKFCSQRFEENRFFPCNPQEVWKAVETEVDEKARQLYHLEKSVFFLGESRYCSLLVRNWYSIKKTVLWSRSRGVEIKLPPGARTEIMNCGSGSSSFLFIKEKNHGWCLL